MDGWSRSLGEPDKSTSTKKLFVPVIPWNSSGGTMTVPMSCRESVTVTNVWVIGGGGIGAVAGGRLGELSRDEVQVTILDGWIENVEAIAKHGVTIETEGTEIKSTVSAAHISQPPEDPPDIVLLAVKSYDTADVLRGLLSHLGEAPVVSLQNGINEPSIAELIGASRTIGCVVKYDGALIRPGRVRQIDPSGWLIIGELDGQRSARMEALANLISPAIRVAISENIFGDLWFKCFLNSMAGALCTVLDCDTATLARNERYADLAVAIGGETIRLARSENVDLPVADLGGAPLDSFSSCTDDSRALAVRGYQRASSGRAGVFPSMHQDVMKGRKTEIDQLNGFIADRTRYAGKRAPLNEQLVTWVRELATGQPRPTPVDVVRDLRTLDLTDRRDRVDQ
jgi:2-dehydropantoate 2-reductase